MTTFQDIVSTTSGTTALALGTAQNLTISKVGTRIQCIALNVVGCDTVYTTAEGSNTILQVVSPSLQLADQRFSTGPYITSGPATNSSGQSMITDCIPVNWIAGGNEIVSFATALTATNTTGKLHNVGLMYSDDTLPPRDWLADYPNPALSRGGYVSAATQTTTTRTALTGITVPTWVQEFTGLKAVDTKTGAITTGQSELGIFDITASIPNIAPMKISTNALGATLGTPVGTGLWHDEVRMLPFWFKNLGGSQTVTPNITLNNAVTTANTVSAGVYWR